MSLTGLRWREARAARIVWLHAEPLPQLVAYPSHSDGCEEKETKSSRGTRRAIPFLPRAVAIFRQRAQGKRRNDYLFSNRIGQQLTVSPTPKRQNQAGLSPRPARLVPRYRSGEITRTKFPD